MSLSTSPAWASRGRRQLAFTAACAAGADRAPPCAGAAVSLRAQTSRGTRASRGAWIEWVGVGLLIVALHAGFAWLAHAQRDTAPIEPPRPLPMTVELTRPPVPLPEARRPPPAAVPPKPQAAPPRPLQQQRRAVPPRTPVPAPPQPVQSQAPQPAPGAAAPAQPAAAAPPAPAVPAEPVRETAPVGDAAYLHNPAPDYPPIAQDQGWEGHVLLRVHVLANGTPDSVEVKTSSGRRLLDDAALAAVRRWVFVPAKRGDTAVDGWVNVPIDFKLG